MRMKPLVVLAAAAVITAAGCSSGHHGGSSAQTGQSASGVAAPTSGTPANSGCSGTTLQSTDAGVTPTTITIEVMADTGATAAPGLAQGSVDAVKAWAKLVNSQGGLACRQVVVRTFDSKLDPTETAAGYADGCQHALAMVGTFAIAVADTSTLASCKNAAGRPIGLPETPAGVLSPVQACNPTDFLVFWQFPACPPKTGVQTIEEGTGVADFVKQQLGSAAPHGTYYVPLASPVVKDETVPAYLFMEQQGLKIDQMVGLPATATQANFTPIMVAMKKSQSGFFFTQSDYPTYLRARAEAVAQGVDANALWFCSTCYDATFIKAGGKLAIGTRTYTYALPYEEASLNTELNTFVAHVSTHNQFALFSWLASRLFQQAVEDLVKQHGPNALTRANLLSALSGVKDFTDGGVIGPITPSAHHALVCLVGLVAEAGGFHRVFPTTPGTLHCGTTGTISVDPDKAFKG
jgi:ABC-type branched-subunit amino acid transport system substrate-binding protein